MRTILLIDGDQPLTRTVAFMLRMMSFVVVTATSGQEAHQLLPATRPDVMLCGDILPDMRAEQLWSALQHHSLWCGIPMIILTTNPQQASGGPGRPTYLLKPFRRMELLDSILTALRAAPEAAA